MRRVLAGSAAALLVTMGPLGLLWVASPAGAVPLSPAGDAAAQAAPALGGFSLSATGEGLRVTYEQPNLPIPATPSAEGDVGYTSATFESGPVGQSTASVLYPGQVVAASGSQLGLIIPGAPPLPNWPVQAHAGYPTGSPSAKDDQGPMTMQARSTAGGSSATAAMGTPSGAAALPAGLVTTQSMGSTSSTGVPAGGATATATASMHDLKVAGGIVEVGSARSSATERSDGRRATCSSTSTVAGVTVAGQPVTVDASGVHASGHDVPIGLLHLTPLQVLQLAGLSMRVTAAKKTTQGAAGSCAASSLELQLDLTKFDADLGKLVADLPSQIAAVVYRLPVPVPDSQVVTFDVGEASAQAAASPAYVPPPFPPPRPPAGSTPPPQPPTPSGKPASSGTPTTPSLGAPGTSAGTAAGSGPAPSGPSGGSALGGASPSSQAVPASASQPAAAAGPMVPTAFKGLGAVPVGLGVLGAAGLALAVTRMDRKILAGARRMVCAARPGGGGTPAAGAAASTASPAAGAGAGGAGAAGAGFAGGAGLAGGAGFAGGAGLAGAGGAGTAGTAGRAPNPWAVGGGAPVTAPNRAAPATLKGARF
jgi:hypothetical protein